MEKVAGDGVHGLAVCPRRLARLASVERDQEGVVAPQRGSDVSHDGICRMPDSDVVLDDEHSATTDRLSEGHPGDLAGLLGEPGEVVVDRHG